MARWDDSKQAKQSSRLPDGFGCCVEVNRPIEGPGKCGASVHADGLCLGHWEMRQRIIEEGRRATAIARSYCLRRGLDTLEKVRAEASRLSHLGFAKPGTDWARQILGREANGEPVTHHALQLAREALAERKGATDGLETNEPPRVRGE